jgi:hypothetical protein
MHACMCMCVCTYLYIHTCISTHAMRSLAPLPSSTHISIDQTSCISRAKCRCVCVCVYKCSAYDVSWLWFPVQPLRKQQKHIQTRRNSWNMSSHVYLVFIVETNLLESSKCVGRQHFSPLKMWTKHAFVIGVVGTDSKKYGWTMHSNMYATYVHNQHNLYQGG